MRIKASVLADILASLGGYNAESGGILGMRDGIVCAFYFDGCGTPTEYRPDVNTLNGVIRDWAERGIEFCGIVHSHIGGAGALSDADMRYAEQILAGSPQLQKIYFPLVVRSDGGRFKLAAFGYDGKWHKERVKEVG